MYYFLFALVLFGCSQNEKRRQVPQETSADAEASPTVSANLPNNEDSPSTSINATVKGTATEYKYAFFSDRTDRSACDNDDDYGEFQSISEKLTITEEEMGGNGHKLVCIIGKKGTNQGQVTSYSWNKISAEASPTVSANLPNNEDSSITSINATVQGTATEYKYAFFSDGTDRSACDNDDDYGEFQSISEKLTITEEEMGGNGHKLVCIIGKKGTIQGQVTSYSWNKISADPQPATPSEPAEPESVGRLDIVTSSSHPTNLYFASAAKGYTHINLSNNGNGDLEWRVEAEQSASWLQAGKEKNNLTIVSDANDIASGTLTAGEETRIYFKLADINKTDYEAGKKTVTLKVYNVSSGDQPVTIDVNMVVPKVELSVIPENNHLILRLNLNQPKGKVMLKNTAGGDWAVKYQLRHALNAETRNEFNDLVSYKELKTTDGKHTKYLEFSVDQNKLMNKEDDYSLTMVYLFITNSSSKGTDSTCGRKSRMEAGTTATLGGEEFRPKFTTNVCHYLWVNVAK